MTQSSGYDGYAKMNEGTLVIINLPQSSVGRQSLTQMSAGSRQVMQT